MSPTCRSIFKGRVAAEVRRLEQEQAKYRSMLQQASADATVASHASLSFAGALQGGGGVQYHGNVFSSAPHGC